MARVRIPGAVKREIAVAASVDPRSLERVLRGERVRGMPDDRIRRELSARGIEPPDPTTSGGASTESR